MKTLRSLSVAGLFAYTVFSLAACGGGDGGSPTPVVTAPPPAVTAPSGSGSVTLDPVSRMLSGSFTTTNVVNASAAHIHDGDVGLAPAANVVVPLTQSSVGSATWLVPAGTVLTDAQITRLRAGGYYVNIHTALNPAGEIRGQLGPASATATTFSATLNLAQEVPTPITPSGT